MYSLFEAKKNITIEPLRCETYSCKVCNKQFSDRNNRNRHYRTVCKSKEQTLENEIKDLKCAIEKLEFRFNLK